MTFEEALAALRTAQLHRRAAEQKFAEQSQKRGGFPEHVVTSKEQARVALRAALEDVMRASDREFVRRL